MISWKDPEPPVSQTPEAAGDRYRWLGPGQVGFLVPLKDRASEDEDECPLALRLRGPSEARDLLGWNLRREEERSLAAYFTRGGSECFGLPVGESFRSWAGRNGGPGERTGVHAFLDLEEVGSVVVPPLGATRVDEFLRLARRSPQLFFYLEERGKRGEQSDRRRGRTPDSLKVLRPLPNVALLGAPVPTGWNAGALAGYLEGVDPRGTARRGESREVFRPSVPLSKRSLESLVRWRYWVGFRRSIDRGSRWLLFEPNHPLVWRRLERETRAFLHQLTVEGVLPPGVGSGFEVSCGPEPTGEGEEGSRVRLSVRVPSLDLPSLDLLARAGMAAGDARAMPRRVAIGGAGGKVPSGVGDGDSREFPGRGAGERSDA